MTGMFPSVVCVDCLITSEAICMTRTVMSSAFVHRYFSHSQHMGSMKRCGYIFGLAHMWNCCENFNSFMVKDLVFS
jgi:hypothetical protein